MIQQITPMFISLTALVGLIAAFILMLLIKLKVIDYLQVHGCKYISMLANCALCLSFWTNVVITIVIVLIQPGFVFILIPLAATPITKLLVFQ